MLKTTKSFQKRIKLSKSRKALHMPIKQNHFKAKLSGRSNQDKRKVKPFYKTDEKAIKKYLPYTK